MRYGQRARRAATCSTSTRGRAAPGFGPEVKRRIMLGTYALRAGYYDAYYKKAQQVRTLIKRDFDGAFAHCRRDPHADHADAGVPRSARRRRRSTCTSADVFTLSCNLAGLPGISVPCGLTADGLPIGAQLLGKPLDEVTLLRAGAVDRGARSGSASAGPTGDRDEPATGDAAESSDRARSRSGSR